MPGIMKVSDAASLGLHAMAYLAQRAGVRCANKAIAQDLGVSGAHLAKVMQRLEHAGLVKSTRGPAGGFELLKAGAGASLKTIYEIIEGPITSTRCLLGEPICNGQCPLGELIHSLDRQVVERLAKISLADFAAKSGIVSPGDSKEASHGSKKKNHSHR